MPFFVYIWILVTAFAVATLFGGVGLTLRLCRAVGSVLRRPAHTPTGVVADAAAAPMVR